MEEFKLKHGFMNIWKHHFYCALKLTWILTWMPTWILVLSRE